MQKRVRCKDSRPKLFTCERHKVIARIEDVKWRQFPQKAIKLPFNIYLSLHLPFTVRLSAHIGNRLKQCSR